MSSEQSNSRQEGGDASQDHLNIKVTDNQNEVFFKIKRTTRLEKLMNAFCERQGKSFATVRFLFEGQRVQKDDTPDSVSDENPISETVFPLTISAARNARWRHNRGSPRTTWWYKS